MFCARFFNVKQTMKRIFGFAVYILAAVNISLAQDIKAFKKGDRICFLGNSITDGGHYHSYIWLYYMTRFPAERIEIFNSGIGGNVVKQMYDRLNDDVLSHQPSAIVLTFGMNDTDYGIYLKPDADKLSAERVKTSYDNYLMLEKRLINLPGIRKILMTSPPFDETAKLQSAVYPDKNKAMLQVNAFMKTSAEKNKWGFTDLNNPMTTINLREQKADSAFTLQGSDRIHPEQNGHLVMAYLFLKAQGFVGREISDVNINAAQNKILSAKYCKVSNLSATPNAVRFNYLAAALPYPVNTVVANGGWGESKSPAAALSVIPFIKELNQEMLTIDGLEEGNYLLKIDRQIIGQWTAKGLASGINLAEQTNTPQYQQAKVIMHLNEERWEIERRLRVYYWYQFDIFRDKGLLFADNQAALDTLASVAKENIFAKGMMSGYLKSMHPEVRAVWQKQMKLLTDQIYTINKPKNRLVEIERI